MCRRPLECTRNLILKIGSLPPTGGAWQACLDPDDEMLDGNVTNLAIAPRWGKPLQNNAVICRQLCVVQFSLLIPRAAWKRRPEFMKHQTTAAGHPPLARAHRACIENWHCGLLATIPRRTLCGRRPGICSYLAGIVSGFSWVLLLPVSGFPGYSVPPLLLIVYWLP